MEPIHFLDFLKKSRRPAVRREPFTLRGFTLLEMTVALSIFAILTAVILSGQSVFNQTILLTDTAYTVALSIRETQTLGLSSIKTLQNEQNAAVGVHFDAQNTAQYKEFADISSTPDAISSWCLPTLELGTPEPKPGNCVYDGATELLRTFTFNDNFTQSFCAYANGNLLGCSMSGSSPQLSSLDIVFERPNTNTVITGTLTSGPYTSQEPDTACIQISAANGTYRYVVVTQLGEIAVSESCPYTYP